jgi:hypothetical protein
VCLYGTRGTHPSKVPSRAKYLAKDFTTRSEGALAKTYSASCKASPNQDNSTYTSGEQEQLIVLSNFSICSIVFMTDYLAWSSKRVSHLIITHPGIMISIIKQIQASITGEPKWLSWVWRNCKRKVKYIIYRIKYQLPLKPSHMDGEHQSPPPNQQIEKNWGVWWKCRPTISRCLYISSQCLPSLHDLSESVVSSQHVSSFCERLDFWLLRWHWCYRIWGELSQTSLQNLSWCALSKESASSS